MAAMVGTGAWVRKSRIRRLTRSGFAWVSAGSKVTVAVSHPGSRDPGRRRLPGRGVGLAV